MTARWPRPPRSPRWGALWLPVLAACAPSAGGVGIARPDPGPLARDTVQPIAPPALAAQLGWMPLAATNVPGFARALPAYDGRGVLIAILDSGIDPGVEGLAWLPDGAPKVADLRDFSSEGRVALRKAELDVELVRIGSLTLRGASRLRAVHTGGPIWGGVLPEIALGEPPAADLNGNGVVGDSLAVLVARATDGWVVFADTDGDGSLLNERPMRDFLQGGDRFGWRVGRRVPPVTVAINLQDHGPEQPPTLDLFFDTSGHGTHVAGIAAGHSLYGVKGFDGVAPGAELMGLKIANDARGGISVTGAMVRAMDYAIRFAAARRKPLVMNLSFGVGNEAEGKARIDAAIDSILAAHPGVVMTISAGNDGPGLSTMGFPATARRGITVGATYPGAFLAPGPNGQALGDLVAFFSARGGEVAQPDLVAPGVAYSTVPRFDVGEEVKNGTSMAAPHVAGLAARIRSGLAAEQRSIDATAIRRALMASAKPLLGESRIDQGAGVPDLGKAWTLLTRAAHPAAVEVRAPGGASGAMFPNGLEADSALFRLALDGESGSNGSTHYLLRSKTEWISAPAGVDLAGGGTVILRYLRSALREPGVYVGAVEGWGADSALGPAFHLMTTVVVPRPLPAEHERLTFDLPAGRLRRIPIIADSGRGISIEVSDRRGAPLLAFLHEPGGMPWRGGGVQAAGAPDSAAVFELDARDVVRGVYELVVMAGPVQAVEATVDIAPAPVRLVVERRRTALSLKAERLAAPAVSVGAELVGAERGVVTSARGSDDQRLSFRLPAWAKHAVIELKLDPEQWPLFTDFGLTLLDAGGRQLGTSPMNYAVGRLEVDLPEGPDRMAEAVLSPGFAEPGATTLWTAKLAIRLYAGEPVLLADELRETFTLPPSPWPLPDGFFPLIHLRARSGNRVWTRESGLPDAPGPLMP